MTEPVAVLLGLGSNLGERDQNLRNGVALLTESLEIRETSSIYETEPWGYADQPRFLNMVCRALTDMSPEDLLDLCKRVERQVGREPTFRYGPRILDVDILAYGDQIIDTPALKVPHPGLHERAFVLVPLAEIAPDWEHPDLRETVTELLHGVSEAEGVRLWEPPIPTPQVG